MALKKRLGLGSLMRKRSSASVTTDPDADTPDANAARGVKLFCESGDANSGEEVLHLPTIVEAAVATPSAAAAAAVQIRKFLSKENSNRPHVQYNSIMLIRILADNPGPSFTKNLDKQFADTVKHLLRNGRDPSVAQILKETLDALEREKAYDTNLNTLFAMWRKEKGYMAKVFKQFGNRTLNAPAWDGSPSGGPGPSASRGLPPPVELAGRIEEARTSAKLLLQLVQSTPANELLGNDLVKEFAERCTTAQRSVQRYIACDNPTPDDDTMLTLIETNEQLSLAASKHQRAILQARRLVGASPSPPVPANNLPASAPPSSLAQPMPPLPPPSDALPAPSLSAPAADPFAPPPSSNPVASQSGDSSLPPSLQAAPNRPREAANPAKKEDEEDPFADRYTSTYTPPAAAPASDRSNGYADVSDPYHPGFQSTPSYLNRQESSANNLTMHGAQPQIAEEEDRQRPQTPDYMARPEQPDVSPIAERSTVTYRY
jgi:hypothetical protein